MLLKFADLLVYDWLGLSRDSRIGGVLHFFVYDSVKIFVLLAAMIFLIGVARIWLPESRLRAWLRGGGLWGNFLAAMFGALTPFCSCSSIPIFITMLKAGVPLGMTFSFLITSPLINEYLVVLMAGQFGLIITAAYVASGLAMGILAGAAIGRMNLEDQLESDIIASSSAPSGEETPRITFAGRLRSGFDEAASVIRQIWQWVLIGVAAGAVIHNYVPREAVHGAMNAAGWFAVPIAVLLGVPMYGSCAAIVPVAVVLFQKGVPLGTALSFMMAIAALSLPEAIMLRRVMRLKLIAIFFGVTTLAIILTGYLLNALDAVLP